ncbi:hypothetical protein C8R46DRAFT_1096928 [Mycena filopes]|nr:hypothetical protein C8R46DRAFT_1096928 [Mycena filopes]
MSPPAVVVLEYVGCRTRTRGLQWTHKDPSVRLNSIELIVPKTKKTISLRCHRSRSVMWERGVRGQLARRSQKLRERHEAIGRVPNGGGRSGTTKCSSARSCTTGVCVRAAIVSRKLRAQVAVNCYIPVLKSGGEQQTASQSIESGCPAATFENLNGSIMKPVEVELSNKSFRKFDLEQALPGLASECPKVANFGDLEEPVVLGLLP